MIIQEKSWKYPVPDRLERHIFKKKFAYENFAHVIYINMAEPSGQQFLQCMDKISEWEPGTPREANPVHKTLELFGIDFCDTKETIIIIDEIQESSRVYNLIRILAKEFFLPAGDLDTVTLETLTFEEFAEVFGKRELYETIDLFGGSGSDQYEQLRECFALYQRIGGYPSVVNKYLDYKSFERCDEELWRLMSIFINESKRYFDDVMETNAFVKLYISRRVEGIPRYFLAMAGANEADIKGITAENFVYLALLRHIRVDIAGDSPWFATYEKTKGELDFYVRSTKDYKNYEIEVKSTDSQAKTARALFDDHKLDYVYYLKGGSNGNDLFEVNFDTDFICHGFAPFKSDLIVNFLCNVLYFSCDWHIL